MSPDEINARYDQAHLAGIESAARWIRQGAEDLQHYTRLLEGRPHFETMAEDAMKEAEAVLTAALLVVKLARNSYDRKPVVLPKFLQAAE